MLTEAFFIYFLSTLAQGDAFVSQLSLLKDGIEHVIQLSSHQITGFKFKILSKDMPLWIYITPCGGSVHWQLFHAKAYSGVFFGRAIESPISDGSEFFGMKWLGGDVGSKRMRVFTTIGSPGILVLTLRSNRSNTARVFITMNKKLLDEHYPPLPTNPIVTYSIVKSHMSYSSASNRLHAKALNDGVQVRLKWNIPREIRESNQTNRYRYCAVVNRMQPDWTFCDELGENLESIHCVNQTIDNLEVDNIRVGRKYYVTLFFRDESSGGVSAFNPIEIFVPNVKGRTRREKLEKYAANDNKLRDAWLETDRLDNYRGASKSFTFPVYKMGSDPQKVLLVLHSCDGYIRVAIYRNGRLINRSVPFRGFRRFLVMNAPSGHLTFKIINDDSKPKVFRLWASVNPRKSPYPLLPDSTSIKETRRNCSSTTLQWLKATTPRIRYCLYRRKETVMYLEDLLSDELNLCLHQMPQSDLIACFVSNEKRINKQPGQFQLKKVVKTIRNEPQLVYTDKKYSNALETTVSGLEPNTLYRFDVLAKPLKFNGKELPYRTLWVKTRTFC